MVALYLAGTILCVYLGVGGNLAGLMLLEAYWRDTPNKVGVWLTVPLVMVLWLPMGVVLLVECKQRFDRRRIAEEAEMNRRDAEWYAGRREG